MHIEFYGAAQEVTGSCHLIEVGQYRVLLDCGLIQGGAKDELRNAESFPFDITQIDAVILSHSHLDHCGRIPLLVKRGFKGPIYTQKVCREMCGIMFRDAANIYAHDAVTANRKRARKHLPPVEPLYTLQDVEQALKHFQGLDYDAEEAILPGIRIRLRDAGHILGSAIVELWLDDGKHQRKVVFSGDLGHAGVPILREPTEIHHADLVIMESTYGGRCHKPWDESMQEMGAILSEAAKAKGNVLIPSFAVGRTQELLYLFAKHFNEWNIGHWQIFLDSPMAIEATEVYLKHSELFNKEAKRLALNDHKLDDLPNLRFTRSPEESMALNRISSGAIIIAGSGMCEGGRIRHHLKYHAWRHNSHILMVGFQAKGTLGRRLVEGEKVIKLWHESIHVAAQVHTVGGFSAYADQQGLLNWLKAFKRPPKLYLVHGESGAQQDLQLEVQHQLNLRAEIAQTGQIIDLVNFSVANRHI
ncbi:metallo-beta-lactamase family protein [Oceanospirillum multiglobuliferum]|uniref:MBL fold metallo-hydrolase n=1 Tax=Oceanospirillum multiglobuliferum TaxID=64969 RepID=A0A1T4MAU3_9GAMM|nr:MBL fold metallo-hydrolase [Oceanospirillum multiglobuliferum]OPX56169.1 MBL fold metallo-hydrolase [Oceanospirillum multiglobuliferum]SJZ64139.1 metallo-beta-lactamase family protein [Oceanospirillum multiglobuliferum]